MHLSAYDRIAVIGCPGSGKSFLARQIAERTGHPLIHMDYEIWQPGWVKPSKEELIAMQREWMQAERWLIDGHWGGTLELRFAAADLVLCLDLPRWLCVWRVLRRRRKSRPDMRPDVQAERSLFSKDFRGFLRFVWYYRKKNLPRVMALREKYPDVRFVHLRTRREVKQLVENQAFEPLKIDFANTDKGDS